MTTTRDDSPPGGGALSRWSPRRWAHHLYLWWAGALLLCAVAAAVAVGLDTSPGPGISDPGALAVLVTATLLSPFLLVGLCMSLSFAVRRRVHDDVRTYGVGQPVRSAVPPGRDAPVWPRPREEVLLRVEVDRVPDAARVVERAVRGGRHRWIEGADEDLRLRSGREWLTATTRDGTVRHRAVRRALPGTHRARWDLELDGRRLSCEVRGIQDPPRRTFLEPDGTAWLLQMGVPSLLAQFRGASRLRPHGRLPEDLAPDAVAFVLWFCCQLEEHLARVRTYGQEVGAMRRDEIAEAWAGWPPPDRDDHPDGRLPDDERASA